MSAEESTQSLTETNSSGHDITSILYVTVKDGKGLRGRLISLDPYLQLEHGGNISISNVRHQTEPLCDFNWTVAFPFHQLHPGSAWKFFPETKIRHIGKSLDLVGDLVVEVKDEYRGWSDRSVGKGVIKYQDILRAIEKKPVLIELIHISSLGRTTIPGSLTIEYRLEKWSPSNFPLPTLNLLENHNTRGGMIRSMIDGCSFGTFPTWQIHLWEVGRIFGGNYCSWSKSYGPAQQIFGPSVLCMVIRQAIRVQHSMLYSKDKGVGTYERHMIRGIEDFIQVLPKRDKATPHDKSVRFTYVITKKSCLNFSITSRKTAQDFLSKHALHNNAREEVVFAGEFFVDRKSERYKRTGKPALVIDNNSGTFAPPGEKLYLLQKLLEFNFGTQFPIITLDYTDAKLREYFDANNID
jgi:hypothetical protein